MSVLPFEDGRLDHTVIHRAIERSGTGPGSAEVFCPFDVRTPACIFSARTAEHGAVIELDRLVFNRAINISGEPLGIEPTLSTIGRGFHHAPPRSRPPADLAIQQHPADLWLKPD